MSSVTITIDTPNALSGPSFDSGMSGMGSGMQDMLTQLINDLMQLMPLFLAMQTMMDHGGGGADSNGMPMGGMPMGGMPTGGGDCCGAPGSCGSSDGGQAGGQIPANMPSGGSSALGPNLPPALQQDAPIIESASQQTGVPANILAAQIWQESRGDPNAGSTNVNGMTDQGLMQVDPATFAQLQQEHPQLQGKSLSDPATNVLAGAYYMSDLYKQFGNWPDALRAYNSGPDQVNPSDLSSVTVGDPNYVSTVMNFASTIQNGGQLPA